VGLQPTPQPRREFAQTSGCLLHGPVQGAVRDAALHKRRAALRQLVERSPKGVAVGFDRAELQPPPPIPKLLGWENLAQQLSCRFDLIEEHDRISARGLLEAILDGAKGDPVALLMSSASARL